MPNIIEAPKQVNVVPTYHYEIERYFSDNHVKIPTLPRDIKTEIALDYFDLEIGSAQQYYNYLKQEIEFWKENDPENKLDTFSHISILITALSQFNEAVKAFNTNNLNSSNTARDDLNSSVTMVSKHGSLYSNLQLTTFLLTLRGKNRGFLYGFKLYFLKDKPTNFLNKYDEFDGYCCAMEYSKVLDGYKQKTQEGLLDFKNNISLANANYAALNELYTTAFREQQQRIQTIEDQTNKYFDDLDHNKTAYFDSAGQRMEELEYLYGEKLKLSEPAKYWDEMEQEYKKKGTKWLMISCALSVMIVAALVSMIIFIPNLFSPDTYWIENLKNSIIMTVITSIAIYMLRLCVKMSTTSYHLSRDAKERSKLSYFYLALIEQNAVSDKERALVLNALFSRSDTGLLKGDSTPSMPSNLSDIVNIVDRVSSIK